MAASTKPTNSSPLTANDIAGLQAILAGFEALKADIGACTRCGMDMAPILQQGQQLADFAAQALKEWPNVK